VRRDAEPAIAIQRSVASGRELARCWAPKTGTLVIAPGQSVNLYSRWRNEPATFALPARLHPFVVMKAYRVLAAMARGFGGKS
jgi:hypothetical protein